MSKVQNQPKKTLDTHHLQKLHEFQAKDTKTQKIQREIDACYEKLQKYKSRDLTDSEFDDYILLKDTYQHLKSQLDKLNNEVDEIDYYVNTAQILFQYYDILENGKDSNCIAKPVVSSEKSILKYFVNTCNNTQTNNVKADRATLLDKYMHVIDSNYIKEDKPHEKPCDKCQHCNSTDRNIMLNEGLISCNNCNGIEYIIVDHERPSYKDPPQEISYFAYFLLMCVKVING